MSGRIRLTSILSVDEISVEKISSAKPSKMRARRMLSKCIRHKDGNSLIVQGVPTDSGNWIRKIQTWQNDISVPIGYIHFWTYPSNLLVKKEFSTIL